MNTEILDIPPDTDAGDPRFDEAERRLRAALAEGRAVALPTETVYGLAAAPDANPPEARSKVLEELKGRDRSRPIAIAVFDRLAAERLVHLHPPGARRLAERFWPGPITLVLPVRGRAALLGVRVPAHRVSAELLRRLGQPLMLTSANPSGSPPALEAEDARRHFDGRIPLVIDSGRSALGEASAVVSFEVHRAIVHREGLIDTAMIRRTAATKILIVCTGNTCRSPMAEVAFRHEWATLRGVPPDRLLEHGGLVHSAGVGAIPGICASPEAVEALAREGLDLRPHRSRPLDLAAVLEADRVYALGRGHRAAILDAGGPSLREALTEKVQLLAGDQDVADPIGGGDAEYQRCWRQIRAAVRLRARELEDRESAALELSAD